MAYSVPRKGPWIMTPNLGLTPSRQVTCAKVTLKSPADTPTSGMPPEMESHKNPVRFWSQRTAKGPVERGCVEKPQKSSKSVKTNFDISRAEQKTSKNVGKCQKSCRHFSTNFAFWGAPMGSGRSERYVGAMS